MDSLASRIGRVAHLTGSFRLRSGATSSEYFDKYRFEADPGLLREVCESLVPKLPASDVLAGLELGGVPIATVLSQLTGRPACFVRKKAKEYGTARLAEGADIEGRTLLLVEDVVTSGGQVVASATALRELGATVTHAVCVIDREGSGTEKLRAAGIDLIALFHASDLRP